MKDLGRESYVGTGRLAASGEAAEACRPMYGTAVEPVVRRIGEIQCTGFYASFPEARFLPGGEDMQEAVHAAEEANRAKSEFLANMSIHFS